MTYMSRNWKKDFKPNDIELQKVKDAIERAYTDNPDSKIWQMIIDSQRVYFYGLQQLVVATMPEKSRWNERLESLYSQQYAVFQALKHIQEGLNA